MNERNETRKITEIINSSSYQDIVRLFIYIYDIIISQEITSYKIISYLQICVSHLRYIFLKKANNLESIHNRILVLDRRNFIVEFKPRKREIYRPNKNCFGSIISILEAQLPQICPYILGFDLEYFLDDWQSINPSNFLLYMRIAWRRFKITWKYMMTNNYPPRYIAPKNNRFWPVLCFQSAHDSIRKNAWLL